MSNMVLTPENLKVSPHGLGHTIPEIFEELGLGKGQLITMLTGCGVFFAEGLELMLVSLLSESIARELTPGVHAQEGFITASIFAGALVGHLLSGLTLKKVGCQFLIIFGYSIIVLFSVSSSFMNSLWSISVFRFFVGLGFGLGQPAAIVLNGEALPSEYRFLVPFSAAVAFGIGTVFAVLLVMTQDVWLPVMEWRLLFRCEAIPCLILGFCSVFFLPESPSFLAENRDHARARDALAVYRSWNDRPGVPVLFKEMEKLPFLSSHWVCLREAFSWAELGHSLLIMGSVMAMSFALWGAAYAIPQAIIEAMQTTWQYNTLAPTYPVITGLIFAGITLASTFYVRSRFNQKTLIALSLIGGMFSTMIFNLVTGLTAVRFIDRVGLVVACIGLFAGPSLALVLLAQATIVMYPSLMSVTCVSSCLCLSRLSAIVAPLLFDSIMNYANTGEVFFQTIMVLELLNVTALLPMDFRPIDSMDFKAIDSTQPNESSRLIEEDCESAGSASEPYTSAVTSGPTAGITSQFPAPNASG